MFIISVSPWADPAAAFAARLMTPVSNYTLLRVVRRRARPPADPLAVIGIDDFAWRRNHRYGTIVCDLERRRTIALLADRGQATAEDWLRAHPDIAVVARDRGGGYGEAIAKALPGAVQVADRWHLMHNASQAFLDAVRKSMRQIRRVIGAATINPDLLTCAERLQYEGYLRREAGRLQILQLRRRSLCDWRQPLLWPGSLRAKALDGDHMILARPSATLFASLFAGVAFAPIVAFAQSVAGASSVSEVVVTGTRDATTTAVTSTSPVDVITTRHLEDTGLLDLARGLETTEPEINVVRASAQPTSSSTRPLTLNGLYPDELLVLIDGKRDHASSVLNTNTGPGRGSAPYDLGAIPLDAIDHIEVLRDGASAQYGSDAIAGVVNIILKSNASGGDLYGQGGVTGKGDGANGDVAFNRGFKLGGDGFLNVTGEADIQEPTDRAAIDQRYNRYTWRLGDPYARGLNLTLNGGSGRVSFGELYGNLLVSYRQSTDTPIFEPPGYSPLFPAGFDPKTTLGLLDVQTTVGARGPAAAGFQYDLSNTFGLSSAAFNADNTANKSLGAASPTSFDAGGPTYYQDVADLTFTRPLPEILAGGTLAAGGQVRYEHYQIRDGDPASVMGAGAASLPGFSPRVVVDNGRTAAAGFIDLELKPASWLTLDGAGRYDHYSDFGGALTYKASARVEVASWLAFRGALGTGFRAPSMQQEYYNTVSTTATGVNNALVNSGTFQVGDAVSKAIGSRPLKPETSHNYSVGAVLTPIDRLVLTAGVFRIDVDNRIVLSDNQSGPAVATALAAAGITNVQQVAFFTNGISTRTTGLNLTLAYSGDIGADTHYRVSVGFDHNWTDIKSLSADAVAPSLTLLSQHSLLLLTAVQPNNKLAADFTLSRGAFSATLDVTRYGSYKDKPISPVQTFSPNTIVDLSASYQFLPRTTATVGVLNLFNVYPDKLADVQAAYATFDNAYVYGTETPDGTDGISFYVRLAKRF